MKRAIPILAVTLVAGAASAAIPRINATCPGGIELHYDQGYAYINGKQAKITQYQDAFDATLDKTTVTVVMNPDGTAIVSYTAPKGANGICTAEIG